MTLKGIMAKARGENALPDRRPQIRGHPTSGVNYYAWDLRCTHDVHKAKNQRWGRLAPPGLCYSTRRKIRDAFVPPNPNEFDSAYSIRIGRFTFGA